MTADMRQPAMHIVWKQAELRLSLAPLQGRWTAEQYLLLTEQTNHLIEFSDGSIEVLPMPTEYHQAMLEILFLALRSFLKTAGGKVRFAPLRVQIRPEKFREPDIIVLCDASDPRRQNRYWLGADMVVEIVSPDNPERDTREKRIDYAEAGIQEYWIVDPTSETITVLQLKAGSYTEYGIFGRGDTAVSALLEGFTISVADILDAN